MAYDGNCEELFTYLSGEMNKQTALRDYIQGEKYPEFMSFRNSSSLNNSPGAQTLHPGTFFI